MNSSCGKGWRGSGRDVRFLSAVRCPGADRGVCGEVCPTAVVMLGCIFRSFESSHQKNHAVPLWDKIRNHPHPHPKGSESNPSICFFNRSFNSSCNVFWVIMSLVKVSHLNWKRSFDLIVPPLKTISHIVSKLTTSSFAMSRVIPVCFTTIFPLFVL